ncbi:MAG: MFS transporter [Chloroflexi bacterium]|nr:MFS transporter [Chloroflexota bacterium]
MRIDTSTKAKERTSARAAGLRVALAFFAFILVGANDGALGVLIPSIRAHYNVDKATVGLIFLAGTAGYLIAAFSSGLLLHKLGQRLFLALGAVAFLVGAAIMSLMPPFYLVPAPLVLLGLGVAIIDAGLNSFIAVLPRGISLLNYLHAFYGVGALLGPLLASALIIAGFGWNSIYMVWVGVSALLLVGAVILFRGRIRQHLDNGEEGEAAHSEEGGNVMAGALRLRALWLAALFLFFYVGIEVSLGSWSYSFLTEERHQTALVSGWVVSGYWLGLTIGRVALARVAERLGSARLIELCIGGVIVGTFIVWLIPLSIAPAVGFWLVGFCLGPIFPTTIASMPRLMPARLVPSAIGFLASVGAMGAALFPWLAGNLAERFGLGSLLPYAAILSAGMLAVWLTLQAVRTRDAGS